MKLQFAKINNLDDIMEIINQAKAELKRKNIKQWQDGYPNEKTIINDINKHRGFIIRKDNRVIAYFVLDLMGEPTYENIYEGKWLNDQNYGTIHRMCIHEDYQNKGYSGDIFDFCKNYLVNHQIFNLRIDTHEDNKKMQKAIKRNNFTYCGIIYLNHTDKRLAYQLEI